MNIDFIIFEKNMTTKYFHLALLLKMTYMHFFLFPGIAARQMSETKCTGVKVTFVSKIFSTSTIIFLPDFLELEN